jgi:hypothetical protein
MNKIFWKLEGKRSLRRQTGGQSDVKMAGSSEDSNKALAAVTGRIFLVLLSDSV